MLAQSKTEDVGQEEEEGSADGDWRFVWREEGCVCL